MYLFLIICFCVFLLVASSQDLFGCSISLNNDNPVIKPASPKSSYSTVTLTWKLNTNISEDISNFTICFCHEKNKHCSDKKFDQAIVNPIKLRRNKNHYYNYTLKKLIPGLKYAAFIIANYDDMNRTSSSRIKFNTLGFGGDAKPCICDKERSVKNECDLKSGKCKCARYATGNHCDKCVASAFYNGHGCESCRCSVNGAINSSCIFTKSGFKSCFCKSGYGSSTCDTCANGFYRNSSKHCTPCNCNGNENNNSISICNGISGKCTSCLENITGDYCQLCAQGFIGNALEQNCVKNDTQSIKEYKKSNVLTVLFTISIVFLFGILIFVSFILIKRRRQRKNRHTEYSASKNSGDDTIQFNQTKSFNKDTTIS